MKHRNIAQLCAFVAVLLGISVLNGSVSATDLTRQPSLHSLGKNTVTIKWRTSSDVISSIKYGPSTSDFNKSKKNASTTKDHELTIEGLSAGKKYYYKIDDGSSNLAGGTDDFYFITDAGTSSNKTFRIWIGGDVGQADSSSEYDCMEECHSRYFEKYGDYHADAVLWAGDTVEDGKDSQYTQTIEINKDILRNSPVFPVRGNHDRDEDVYYDSFAMPTDGRSGGLASATESYYSWEVGPAHFIAITQFEDGDHYKISPTTSRDEGREQYNWLKADLENIDKTKIKWIIVYTHHPFYSRGHHATFRSGRSGDSRPSSRSRYLQEDVVPLLEANGVDLVLTGHNHCLERSHLMHGYKEWDNSDDHNFVKPKNFILSKGSAGEYVKSDDPNTPGTIYCTMPSAATASKYDADGDKEFNDELVDMLPTIIGKEDPSGHSDEDAVGFGVMEISKGKMEITFIHKSGSIMDTFSITKDESSSPPPIALDPPQASPESGTYYDSVTVTLLPEADEEIYYSLDGSTPSISYNTPIVIDSTGTTTIKAIAKQSGFSNSTIMTATYTIKKDTSDPSGVINQAISSDNDDAEENESGDVVTNSWILELGEKSDANTVGLRFQNINISKQVAISNAYIQLTAYAESSESHCELTVSVQDSNNPSEFEDDDDNLSDRLLASGLSTSIILPKWNIGDKGNDQRLNVTPLVQYLINKSDWKNNNAICFIISGTGTRKASSFRKPSEAATLHIEFNDDDNSSPELLDNPGIEDGLQYWQVRSTADIAVTSDAKSGSSACAVTDRAKYYAGVRQDIKSKVISGQTYAFSANVKLTGASNDGVILAIKLIDGEGSHYITLDTKLDQSPDQWITLSGSSDISWTGSLTKAELFVYTVKNGALSDFILDDASMTEDN